jgi:hypothetical protein
MPQDIGWTHWEAKAAMHAFVDQFVRGRTVRVVPDCAYWLDDLLLRH